jgi:hypothetical protein
MATLLPPKGPRRHAVATVIGRRLHFRRVLATSPLVYRRTFRRIGA